VSDGMWVCTHDHGGTRIESVDGIEWSKGEPPARWHRCRPQTRGWIGLDYTERCRCGAARMAPCGPWLNRNETRTARRKQQREDALPRVTVTCRDCGKPYEAAEGTSMALAAQCTDCWAIGFMRDAGYRTTGEK